MSHRQLIRLILASTSLVSVACGGGQKSAESPATPAAAETAMPADSSGVLTQGKTVEVKIEPKSGSQVSGKATLTEAPDGVKVVLALEHMPPGEHGAHVHEKGDCSAPDGSSAGGHFNPAGNPHALPDTNPHHLGDLGNITIDANGNGHLEIVAAGANLKENDANSFLGRSIIVHEKKDDGGQPTGNAGGRIACGEIH
jgi:Cu-Zn family superoxide dismutase